MSKVLYAEWRTTKNLVTLPKRAVAAMAPLPVYEPLMSVPCQAAVRNAGEDWKKLAMSFASLYFSRSTVRSSVMTAP